MGEDEGEGEARTETITYALSTCTSVVLEQNAPPGECSSFVRTLQQPPRSTPFSSGAYQAPCGISTTPGMMRSVTRAGMIIWPLSLNTRTWSPSLIPLAWASPALINTAWVCNSRSHGRLSYWECARLVT